VPDPNGVTPALEIVAVCPLCGSGEAARIAGGRDRVHGLPGQFGFVRCSGCSLVRLSPRPAPEALGFYYPAHGYYSYSTANSVEAIRHDRFRDRLRDAIREIVLDAWGYRSPSVRSWRRAIQPLLVFLFERKALYGKPRRFPRFVPGGLALDVGSGSGVYLSFLKKHGWNVQGVDIGAEAVRAARESFGIDVFEGNVEDAPFPPESFDFIHMSHVIEHLPDPVATLAHVATLLRPGGTLYIETPNVESYGRRRCGEYWCGWDAPRHLFLFTPETLRRSVERAGLRVAKLWTEPWPGIYSWEHTYRLEEQRGAFLEERPAAGQTARFRSAALDFLGALHHRIDALDGEIVACRAERP